MKERDTEIRLMTGRNQESETTREQLSQAILDVLDSWPALHRYVFSQVHYGGRTIDHISQALAIQSQEVQRILEHCEGDLRNALRTFRSSSEEAYPLQDSELTITEASPR